MGGRGHFFAWDGGCILIGKHTDPVPPHAHHAIQIVFGSDARIRLRGGDQEPWVEHRVAVIPSRQPHSLDGTTASYGAVIFVEPETKEGRALTELYLRDGIASVDDSEVTELIPGLFNAWLDGPTAATVTAAVWQIIRALTGGVQPAIVTDPRIERAIAYIIARLGSSLTLDEVAREAYLSPSRFRHLFVEQTGMGLRPYILWRRLLKVWEVLMAGDSLSTAAHVAGFADSAHLTRTSRRMFGIPPSAIQIASALPARVKAL
jgi:AraC family transcriptional regulator